MVIAKLISFDKGFLLAVLRELSAVQKIKMVFKLLILKIKSLAGKAVGSVKV